MKTAISIIVIILSLIAFAFAGVLLSVDYKKVQQEFVDLLSADATSQVTAGRIEIDKFPTPKLIAHNIKIPGVLEAQQMVVNFSLASILQRKPRITTIDVHQPGFDLTVLVQYEGDKLSYGKATIRTGHIAQFLKDYPDLQTVMTSLIPAHAADLAFDIVASDEYLTFTNLKVNSKVLECSGEIALSRSSAVLSKMQLVCDKVVLGDEELNKVSISGKSDNDGLHLETATGTMVSGGSFVISGDLTKNIYRSAFEGSFQLNHNDMNAALSNLGMKSLVAGSPAKTVLESNFRITPAEFLLRGLKGQVGSLSITGSSGIKFIGSTPRILLNFNINGFDSSNEYPVISPLFQYLSSLLQGTEERNYTTKFVPVRNIDYLGSYQVSLDAPVIAGNAGDRLDISGNASTGKLDIKSFNYTAGSNHLAGSLALDTVSIKPVFSLNITSGVWNTEALTLANLLAINSSLQNADLSKVNLVADMSLQSLSQGDIDLGNVKLNMQSDGNIISIPLMSATIGDSNVQMNGTLSIASSMSVNIAYVYNLVNLNSITKLFGSNVGLDGIANFAGIVSANGTTAKELLYNLYTKSKFMATKVDAQGFSIDDLITKLSSLKYDKNNLDSDIKLATSEGVTSLNGITGNLNMESGIISLKDVVLASKYTSGTLEMAYNIYNQDLNFTSLWSFQLPLAYKEAASTYLKISLQKKGQDTVHNIDTTELLKAFKARAVRDILSNPAQPVWRFPLLNPNRQSLL